MSITTVGSNLIHYEALGRGNPLVFIHGWLGSWRYWWPTMQGLSARHRVFAFDLWGFGDSSKAKNCYSLNAYVDMLDQFVDKLGIVTPVTLVGHSLGAAVALRYTKTKPELVHKLIAVSLPVNGGHMNTRLTNTDPSTFMSKVLGKSNSFTEVESELRKTDPEAMNRLAQELLGYNFAADLLNFPKPVLMVFGEADTVVNPPAGDYHHLQNSGNNRYYVGIDNCNHFPMLQETAKFNRLLLDFLASDDDMSELTLKEYWTRRTH
ncbi:MAG: alpha/beta hydrolase [Anaerolineales bacterium]|nr:alpha/beta hydrolase [Anaerolineales bacterium]